jgi:hypothetical protein
MKGFLGTWGSFGAELNLLIQFAMGVALLVGAFLAWAKPCAAHGTCQAVVLILNLPMIALVMWPSLHVRVLPQLSRHFEKRYYAVATAHGVLTEVLGLRFQRTHPRSDNLKKTPTEKANSVRMVLASFELDVTSVCRNA